MAQTKLGAAKVAATKIGVSFEEYLQNVNSGLKWCFRCQNFIPRDSFSDARGEKDGKNSVCKDCFTILRRSYKSYYKPIPLEERKPRDYNYYPPRDGDKRQARRSVTNAIRRGELSHASVIFCTDCGHLGNDKRHEYDHYLGYKGIDHLNVQCVCNPCHNKRERRRRKQQKEITNAR